MSLKSSYSKKLEKFFHWTGKKCIEKYFVKIKSIQDIEKKMFFLENNFKTIKQMFQ